MTGRVQTSTPDTSSFAAAFIDKDPILDCARNGLEASISSFKGGRIRLRRALNLLLSAMNSNLTLDNWVVSHSLTVVITNPETNKTELLEGFAVYS
jgi:hypothetical protein